MPLTIFWLAIYAISHIITAAAQSSTTVVCLPGFEWVRRLFIMQKRSTMLTKIPFARPLDDQFARSKPLCSLGLPSGSV
jgi:hypothetical protein